MTLIRLLILLPLK
jgi:hypothetical protein